MTAMPNTAATAGHTRGLGGWQLAPGAAQLAARQSSYPARCTTPDARSGQPNADVIVQLRPSFDNLATALFLTYCFFSPNRIFAIDWLLTAWKTACFSFCFFPCDFIWLDRLSLLCAESSSRSAFYGGIFPLLPPSTLSRHNYRCASPDTNGERRFEKTKQRAIIIKHIRTPWNTGAATLST